MTRAGTLVALALGLALAGCGSGGDSAPAPTARSSAPPAGATPAPPADPEGVRVVRGWSEALRRGDVERASTYFAVPSVVQNYTAPIRLATRAAVRAFNRSLPCGGRLLATRRAGGYTVATFLLTDRPGGNCGRGTGDRAQAAFLVRRGHIARWVRVADGVPAGDSPGTAA